MWRAGSAALRANNGAYGRLPARPGAVLHSTFQPLVQPLVLLHLGLIFGWKWRGAVHHNRPECRHLRFYGRNCAADLAGSGPNHVRPRQSRAGW